MPATRFFITSVVLFFVATANPALAQQSAHAGHDAPDPSAPVLGEVNFPTGASTASHKAFVRGVLFMHNFHYPQAAAAFREAQHLDSTNVMAYWGEALSYTHAVWNEQDTAAADKALRRLAPTREARLALARNPRERQWLEAAEILYSPSGSKARRDTLYSAAMERVHATDTSDVEATTLYALSLLGLNQGDRDIPTYKRAYDLVAPVFAAHPKHPGAAHYLIHAVDDPEHAGMGLAAALAYSSIAPSAGHAIHMTSHIFLALGKWDDVVDANTRAQRANPSGLLTGHVVHWLHYGLLQQGRYKEADRWLDSMVRQARAGPPNRRVDCWDAAGAMASANLADSRRWNGHAASVSVDTTMFGPSDLVDYSASQFGFALGALERGQTVAFKSVLSEMEARRKAVADNANLVTARGMAEVMEKTLRGFVQEKSGDRAGAIATFRDAANQEASLPMPFGPPLIAKPPREAAAEALLASGHAAEARSEFLLALARTPRRPSVLLGLARAEKALGNRAASRSRYRELLGIWHSADADLPALSEVRAGAK